MSLYAIFSILSFLAFLGCYIAHFVLGKEGKVSPVRQKILMGAFLLFALALQVFLVLWGISLFEAEAKTQSYFIGLLLGLILGSGFFYPFAKKIGSKVATATIAMFFLSGAAFLADAISIAYALILA